MSEGTYKQLLIDDLARLTHIENHRLNLLINDQSEIKHQGNNTSIARSPARIAVALLLQNPEIYTRSIPHINPALLDEEEHHILLKLLHLLKSNPQASTATLIESWRTSSYFDTINKLAAWEHQVPEQELIKEFIDIFLFLQKQNQDLFIRQLIDKSRQIGLSEQEKLTLLDMLKERHLQTGIEK
jgi:DNA primase